MFTIGGFLTGSGQGPALDFFCGAIDDNNLLQGWHVDVDVGSGSFELKGFRLTAQLVLFLETLIGDSIDGSDGSSFLVVSAGDVNALRRCVIPQIVCAAFKVDGSDEVICAAVINVDPALTASDEKLVRFGRKGHPLRIRHSGDGVLKDSPADINHLDFFIQFPRLRSRELAGHSSILAVQTHASQTQSCKCRRDSRTLASSFFFALSTSGKAKSSWSNASMIAEATIKRVNHLLSAGTTYHGACFVAVC